MMAADRPTGHEDERDEPSELERRRRARNYALLAVLGGLVILFYVISIVKMSGGH